jgi:ABC-type branched-subunit amino acid transport system ATPase component
LTGSTHILTVRDLKHAYGGVEALSGCTLEVERGSLTALIGPNGAGKTTLVNVVSGAEPVQYGAVTFDGVDIRTWPAYMFARRGLLRSFQLSREFGGLTVVDNLLVVAQDVALENPFSAIFKTRAARRMEASLLGRVKELLQEVGLFGVRNQYARELSGGQNRLLELARVMIAEPKFVILDEPMAGVNPVLIERVGQLIQLWNSRGVTFLIVEHKLDVVEAICDYVIVMANGRRLAAGTMGELRADPAVVSAYLGVVT